ncbi:MAG: efflux RND transporter permease subunit [Myxococcales bacterium]|jgi:multidrug efflux pump subunit AcrB
MTTHDEPHLPEDDALPSRQGPLAWITQNGVAANLIMALLIVGGLLSLPTIKREVFPEFELDMVTIGVAYPGASPEEVEQGVVLAVEEAVRGIDGVKEVRSTAAEGAANVMVELLLGADRDRALADIKSAVDRITSFPVDAERPVVSLVKNERAVLSVILYGDLEEKPLRALAERTREALLQHEGITQVELSGERPLEISIEIPQDRLRSYGLTLDQVAQAVRAASVELPAGGVKTDRGEILVRMAERRDIGREFEDIVLLSQADGTTVRIGDVANVRDAFADTDAQSYFDGKRAQRINVYRIGDEGPIDVSEAVHEVIADLEPQLPQGVKLAVWDDRSEMYADRQDLLMSNSQLGLILVILVLGLFLEVRLAFWVTLGIPISFIGSLLFLPALDVSINMISLFAFIVTLGMVVDDAIIVGEAIHKHRRDGMGAMDAAIAGVREVARPVTFSILTTVIAFLPLLFVPGMAGKFFRNIPLVVISVLAISLVESLMVLPAHLSHDKSPVTTILGYPFRLLDSIFGLIFRFRPVDWLLRQQQRFSHFLEWFIDRVYGGQLLAAAHWRYTTVALCIGMLVLTIGLVAGGRIAFLFLPKVDGDVVSARIEMPVGTPVQVTLRHQRRALDIAHQILGEHGGEDIARGIFAEIGGAGRGRASSPGREGSGAGHLADVQLFLVPTDQRDISSSQFARQWRERMGDIPGAEKVSFEFSTGHSGGFPVHVRLSHANTEVLEQAAHQLANAVRGFDGTYDVSDGVNLGKEQLDLTLTPQARSLGLSQLEVARQVRGAFFGAEVLRQQRGREELRVYVRPPEAERRTEHDIAHLMIRTPQGGEIPLSQAADIERGRAYTSIQRSSGQRTLDVTAEVDPTVGNGAMILGSLARDVLPELMADNPGLTYTFEGQGKERAEMMSGLGDGFIAALIAMYGLLAVAFRSYFQPLLVLSAIPFGIVGAAIGHVVMGYEMSLMTMFGVVALSGVVVNDSLILVDAINRYRAQGLSTFEAVLAGGKRRFRPILLTSLTTFLGLTPMILETSVQARFLIPMAISLGFGVLFATFVILLMVPSTYLILDDLAALIARLRRGYEGLGEHQGRAAPPAE